MPDPQAVKLRIVAENLARAALQEAKKDVQSVGQAAGTAAPPFANLVRYFDQGNRTGTLFRNALQQLSFQAAAIPGPIGKAGAAILGLGVSGGPILIATAALGAFGLAWKAAGEAGELAASNVESAARRMHDALARVDAPDLLRTRIAQMRAELDRLRTAPLGPQRFEEQETGMGVVARVPVGSPEEDRAADIRAVETALGRFTMRLHELDRDAGNTARRGMQDLLDQLQEINAEVAHFLATPFLSETLAGIPGFRFPQALKAEEIAGAGAGRKAQLEGAGALSLSFFDQPKTALKSALVEGGEKAAVRMAQVFVTALGQFHQGGPAGVLGGAGSLLTGASQLKQLAGTSWLGPAGFALSAVSTLVSLFGNEQTRLLKEQLAELKKLNARPIFEPRAPTNVFVGSGNSPAETEYLVGRRYDRDAFARGGRE